MIIGEYKIHSRQLQVQGMLETLTLEKETSENGITSSPKGFMKMAPNV